MDITWHLRRNYEKLADRLPEQVAGRLDLATPFYRSVLGGPTNGQLHRQELVRTIAAEFDFGRVVETGSGAVLNRDYLTTCGLEGWRLSYPAVPSQIETGSKRGCCVLSSPGMDLALSMLACAGTL